MMVQVGVYGGGRIYGGEAGLVMRIPVTTY
jgi:hypothetical protein